MGGGGGINGQVRPQQRAIRRHALAVDVPIGAVAVILPDHQVFVVVWVVGDLRLFLVAGGGVGRAGPTPTAVRQLHPAVDSPHLLPGEEVVTSAVLRQHWLLLIGAATLNGKAGAGRGARLLNARPARS